MLRSNSAGWPIWVPLLSPTRETPGQPCSVQSVVPVLVSCSSSSTLDAPASWPVNAPLRWSVVQRDAFSSGALPLAPVPMSPPAFVGRGCRRRGRRRRRGARGRRGDGAAGGRCRRAGGAAARKHHTEHDDSGRDGPARVRVHALQGTRDEIGTLSGGAGRRVGTKATSTFRALLGLKGWADPAVGSVSQPGMSLTLGRFLAWLTTPSRISAGRCTRSDHCCCRGAEREPAGAPQDLLGDQPEHGAADELRQRVRELEGAGLLLVDWRYSGGWSARPSAQGRDAWAALETARGNKRARRRQMRDEYLGWVVDQDEAGASPTSDDFLTTGASYLGMPYTQEDLEQTGKWLREGRFIEGPMADQRPDPLRPSPTRKVVGSWRKESP